MRVGTLVQFIGGGIGRAASAGFWTGIFFVAVGVTPWRFVASLIQEPPGFLNNSFFSPALVLLGLATIWASLWFNLWSRKQVCIDEISEELAWAVHHLLNNPPKPLDLSGVEQWWTDVLAWEAKVSKMLGNRAFFTRSDEIHFAVLGFVDPSEWSTGNRDLDSKMRQLKMKFERLRDIVNWTQMRRR
jgi:hypothetical protein